MTAPVDAPPRQSHLVPDRGFVVAGGIECSAPVLPGGYRQDELRKTGHWDRVESDLALVASFGITTLRIRHEGRVEPSSRIRPVAVMQVAHGGRRGNAGGAWWS